jgi:hypothetical protein
VKVAMNVSSHADGDYVALIVAAAAQMDSRLTMEGADRAHLVGASLNEVLARLGLTASDPRIGWMVGGPVQLNTLVAVLERIPSGERAWLPFYVEPELCGGLAVDANLSERPDISALLVQAMLDITRNVSGSSLRLSVVVADDSVCHAVAHMLCGTAEWLLSSRVAVFHRAPGGDVFVRFM